MSRQVLWSVVVVLLVPFIVNQLSSRLDFSWSIVAAVIAGSVALALFVTSDFLKQYIPAPETRRWIVIVALGLGAGSIVSTVAWLVLPVPPPHKLAAERTEARISTSSAPSSPPGPSSPPARESWPPARESWPPKIYDVEPKGPIGLPEQAPAPPTAKPQDPASVVANKPAPAPEYRGVIIEGAASVGSYPPHWRIGKIEWRGLTDLRVNVANPDPDAAVNLELVIATEPYLIYQMTQLSELPNVTFPDEPMMRDKFLTVTGFDFQKIPLDSSGPNFGATRRRILCERVPPGATLRVAMELGVFPSGPPGFQPLPDDTKPFSVKVTGSYRIGDQPRNVDSGLIVSLGDESQTGRSVGAQRR